MKNGCMENETYRLNWVFVDKINESLFEAVANDMEKFPEKYKNVKVVERDKIIKALKNVDNYLQKIAELQKQLKEKEEYTYTGKEVGEIERKYDEKIDTLEQQLKSQPAEIVEKIKNYKGEYFEWKIGDKIYPAFKITEEDLDKIWKEYQK